MQESAATGTRDASWRTGVPGLDDVLNGGFAPGRTYLIEGVPGSGKTTLALQFISDAAARGEPTLYVSLSETEEELRVTAHAHGLPLEHVTVRELLPSFDSLEADEQYTIFHPSEVELGETTRRIVAEVERLRPRRMVFDSLSELRLLAASPLRFRRQILGLKRFFAGRDITVLLLDDLVTTQVDQRIESLVHGVVSLEQMNPEYGSERRRLQVTKYRAIAYRGGYHDYVIRRGGLRVFPRIGAATNREIPVKGRLSSGVPEVDEMLGGGLERGTSTLIMGAAGTGKSTLASCFVAAAAERGQSSLMLLFDEHLNTMLTRCDGLGIDLRRHLASSRIRIKEIDPAEMSPGELVSVVEQAVRQDGITHLVVDSLNGYLNAMPGERFLLVQLHELLSYLAQNGVATLLVGAHRGLVAGPLNAPVDSSYLADSIIVLRYVEVQGEVRKAIAVVKKRGGDHDRTIRDFRITRGGLAIGPPLRQLRGILAPGPAFEIEAEDGSAQLKP